MRRIYIIFTIEFIELDYINMYDNTYVNTYVHAYMYIPTNVIVLYVIILM